MKHIFSIVAALLIMAAAHGQSYVGTLTTNSYSQKEARMAVTVSGQRATLEMHRVKFAKLMPVKVDVEVRGLTATVQNTSSPQNSVTTLKGDNIIPLSNGKPHKKHTIRNLKATATPTALTFECLMGDKHVSFKGQAKAK